MRGSRSHSHSREANASVAASSTTRSRNATIETKVSDSLGTRVEGNLQRNVQNDHENILGIKVSDTLAKTNVFASMFGISGHLHKWETDYLGTVQAQINSGIYFGSFFLIIKIINALCAARFISLQSWLPLSGPAGGSGVNQFH